MLDAGSNAAETLRRLLTTEILEENYGHGVPY